MAKHYSVTFNSQKVGEASVENIGLYLQIQCKCQVPGKTRYRFIMRSGDICHDLGLCASENGIAEICNRIPAKLVGALPFAFYLKEETKSKFFPIIEGVAFPHIKLLQKAVFTVQDGVAGITVRES